MAVISRARKQGLIVTLNDILQSKSVKELAQVATVKAPAATQPQEKSGEGFGLSPVQMLYMQSSTSFKGLARFNQSLTVRIARRVEGEVLRRAIKAVTSQHSMLQARFIKVKNGIWEQRTGRVCTRSVLFLREILIIPHRKLILPTDSACTL
jgi:hypothetical protein